ncbi:MAG TPA: hypothetical protein PK771_06865 [Spirochaetota bacterium]|nr:hypothetical protein [Spirochaetota bacterium]
MEKEYDFSKGIKGKFYVPEKDIELPIYLDKENLNFYMKISNSKKIRVSQLINEILSKDRELVETIKL